MKTYSRSTKISDVIQDPVFEHYGRLLFPVNRGYMSGTTLGRMDLTWYSCIDPDRTVEIVQYLHNCASCGEQIFFDIYSEADKQRDPEKRNTGLFFFRGNAGAKTAICCAGGGFAYVGAMHDSFPHALQLSKLGYNAFAILYRPDAQKACEDLAQAIAFLHQNAAELKISMQDYSLWGGSAGARMAAWLGCYGTASFIGTACPKPSAVIMQYTGMSQYSPEDPPTYMCVGDSDWIVDWRIMKRRAEGIRSCGTPAECHVYPGLGHGFGLGTGTCAEGWLPDAVHFWAGQSR